MVAAPIRIGAGVLMTLVVVHVGAIAWYTLRKHQNLLGPMLHGDKQLAFAAPESRDTLATRLVALALVCACAGLVVSAE